MAKNNETLKFYDFDKLSCNAMDFRGFVNKKPYTLGP